VVEEVRKRQKNLGPDAVRFAWVKTHVGTQGNEKADQMAKSGAELGMEKVITERSLSQEWKRRRAEERKVKRMGVGTGTASRASIPSTVVLEKATFKPGDICWIVTFPTNPDNAGGMLRQGNM